MAELVRGTAVIVTRQGYDGEQFLVAQRLQGSHKGEWLVPGGKVEPGETDAEAAARELLEETGLVAPELVLLGEEALMRLDDGRKPVCAVFLAADVAGEPQNLEPDVNSPWLWLTWDDLMAARNTAIARSTIRIYRNE